MLHEKVYGAKNQFQFPALRESMDEEYSAATDNQQPWKIRTGRQLKTEKSNKPKQSLKNY